MSYQAHKKIHHFSATSTLIFALSLTAIALASCAAPTSRKGGTASASIRRGTHTNAVSLAQSDDPKTPSTQSLESEQLFECILPAGTRIALPIERAGETSGRHASNLVATSGYAVLGEPVPVKILTKDRSETKLGAAQKNRVFEWAARAANVRPVMWAGIGMMTLVAGAFIYFHWWTKAAAAIAIGATMIFVAQVLPDHGVTILTIGLGVFTVIALLVLYAYHKGQLDLNLNGIPDFLERPDHESAELGISSRKTLAPTQAPQI